MLQCRSLGSHAERDISKGNIEREERCRKMERSKKVLDVIHSFGIRRLDCIT